MSIIFTATVYIPYPTMRFELALESSIGN